MAPATPHHHPAIRPTGVTLSLLAALLGVAASFDLARRVSPTTVIAVIGDRDRHLPRRRHPAAARGVPGSAVGSVLAARHPAEHQRHAAGVVRDPRQRGASRSLVPDLFSVPAYVLIAVGLMDAVRIRRRGSGAVDAVLDSSLAGLASLALGLGVPHHPRDGAILDASACGCRSWRTRRCRSSSW